jgi:hypothetical protein
MTSPKRTNCAGGVGGWGGRAACSLPSQLCTSSWRPAWLSEAKRPAGLRRGGWALFPPSLFLFFTYVVFGRSFRSLYGFGPRVNQQILRRLHCSSFGALLVLAMWRALRLMPSTSNPLRFMLQSR